MAERAPHPVAHLENAVELLWQAGHPRTAEALKEEVDALAEKAWRFERILYPRLVPPAERASNKEGKA